MRTGEMDVSCLLTPSSDLISRSWTPVGSGHRSELFAFLDSPDHPYQQGIPLNWTDLGLDISRPLGVCHFPPTFVTPTRRALLLGNPLDIQDQDSHNNVPEPRTSRVGALTQGFSLIKLRQLGQKTKRGKLAMRSPANELPLDFDFLEKPEPPG